MSEPTFFDDVQKNIESISMDRDFLGLSTIWNSIAIQHKYAYNFSWLGRPIIQLPSDIYIIQELIWKVRPDLIIETGIAHGGSLIMSASMLALLDYCDAINNKESLNPILSKRKVLGIDIDIRKHNRKAIEEHCLHHMIEMIEGSSIDQYVINKVESISKNYKKILIFLDSNHTHDHVLSELNAYARLTSVGSYCVVWDTGIEDLPEYINKLSDRPWGKGNNPRTAVYEYLKNDDNFIIDKTIAYKLAITAAIDGFLLRTK